LWGGDSIYPSRQGALRWRGVPRQDVAREAHGGVKSLLASRLWPHSSKETHSPKYHSLHTVGPYLARRVGGKDVETVRSFVHCNKRLASRRIGLRESLGDPVYPYAAGITATSLPPESGSGALEVASPHQRKRTRGAAEGPPARGGAVRRTTPAGASPAGRSACPPFSPPGVPYYPALRAGQSLSEGIVTPR